MEPKSLALLSNKGVRNDEYANKQNDLFSFMEVDLRGLFITPNWKFFIYFSNSGPIFVTFKTVSYDRFYLCS